MIILATVRHIRCDLQTTFQAIIMSMILYTDCGLQMTNTFYRVTACNATHGIAKAFLSVCPSVCQTHGLWRNERNLCSHSYTTRKIS